MILCQISTFKLPNNTRQWNWIFNKFSRRRVTVNKYIVKANELWRENRLEAAIHQYEKAISCQSTQTPEKQISHYMCAYLNCVLARRYSQEEAFLGVDLRAPYQDFYLIAGKHMAELKGENFEPDALGLPILNKEAVLCIEQAYSYYQQLRNVYIQSWRLRVKEHIRQYMSGFMHRLQVNTRA